MDILKETFGRLKNGKEIIKYSLINDNNFLINILNYGGIITEIIAPDKEGNPGNVVLGFDNIRDYEEKSPYFGAAIGRNAGRISNAKFEINGQRYTLAHNNGKNNLHGGNKGFDKVIWDVENVINNDFVELRMSYLSIDGEEGFPGNLDVNITYFLNNNNELEIKYSAISDKDTIINLTNHTYFNLSGDLKKDVLEHKLTINADKVAYVDNQIIPTGELVDVRNTVFDFRKAKEVGKDINKEIEQLVNCGGYDHPFVLNKDKSFSARLEDEKSGRVLEIITDQPIIVFYSGNGLGEELILRGNRRCKKHLGLCLETQDYPDAINQANFPTKIYRSGEKYEAYTKYKFYVNS
ncbi:aldose epimerase family protein [Paramaledivibacter caminithermalis]|jgi:aldose 1-epimerase|uniref:Aldose 1-epimerase n=1 Tax=Paramaledivibacter caminithermalis (strain DSM 15212 / CIP 107654 / DViRD3) TaxID=1121301 RepID=A0A1M6NP13_PARC5|nr:aldose epimerase family protein [Paramaledivibacter caminithermalis]SHJ97394.1 aldose 1-epimerase [Paramaledivibacter caminithermalis DSM 15212]